eukprot:3203213-Prymnesium_polylepis.1
MILYQIRNTPKSDKKHPPTRGVGRVRGMVAGRQGGEDRTDERGASKDSWRWTRPERRPLALHVGRGQIYFVQHVVLVAVMANAAMVDAAIELDLYARDADVVRPAGGYGARDG